MLLEILPKVTISSIVAYLKGKSHLIIYEQYPESKYKYGNGELWCRGYYVDTAGKNEKRIKSIFKTAERRLSRRTADNEKPLKNSFVSRKCQSLNLSWLPYRTSVT